MTRIALSEGTRAGAVLSACVIVLAVIGLTPSLSWVPEVPLLASATVLPLFILLLTGLQAGRRSRRMVGGLLAGAIAGAIGGMFGGLAYVWFGKPFLNVLVGLLLGAGGGSVLGSLGALFAIRRRF